MRHTGIFITSKEREQLEVQYKTSGMFLSGGMPMGDPGRMAADLAEKYKAPEGAGIDLKTGEFCLP